MQDGNKMTWFIRRKTWVRKSIQIPAVFHLTRVKGCPGFKRNEFEAFLPPLPAKGFTLLAAAVPFGCQGSWSVCGLSSEGNPTS